MSADQFVYGVPCRSCLTTSITSAAIGTPTPPCFGCSHSTTRGDRRTRVLLKSCWACRRPRDRVVVSHIRRRFGSCSCSLAICCVVSVVRRERLCRANRMTTTVLCSDQRCFGLYQQPGSPGLSVSHTCPAHTGERRRVHRSQIRLKTFPFCGRRHAHTSLSDGSLFHFAT